jgi:hypothetical protein
MLTRVEKLAAAKIPPQSGFASIPLHIAADLFNGTKPLSAARFQEFTGFSCSLPTPARPLGRPNDTAPGAQFRSRKCVGFRGRAARGLVVAQIFPKTV